MKSSKNWHGYYCLTEQRSQSEFELHFEVLRIRSFLFSQSSPASASVAFMFTPTLSCCDTESPTTQFLKPLLQPYERLSASQTLYAYWFRVTENQALWNSYKARPFQNISWKISINSRFLAYNYIV
jgi:hypothetical protein